MSGRKWKTRGFVLLICLSSMAAGAEEPQRGDIAQQADDPCLQQPNCRDLYDGARRLSQSQQYEGALVMYQSAYALQPRPWLLVNIGRMQHKLGHPEQAIVTYKRFLDDPTTATDMAFSAKAHEFLEAAQRELAEQQAKLHPVAPPISLPSPSPPPPRPLYKKWWLWTIVGGAVALTAIGIGVGIGVSSQNQIGVPSGVSAFYPTF